MDAERFVTGLTYAQFKDGMTKNREAIDWVEAGVTFDPRDLAYFRAQEPLRVVAIVEDWCSDVVAGLPVVARLAEAVGGGLDLRCFIRDAHPDLIAPYLNGGGFESVPVFAFFDRDWREVGVFIERPAAVSDRRADDIAAIYAEHPEFAGLEPTPKKMGAELYAQLRALLNERRRGWQAWADRQLVLALRDATARATRGEISTMPQPKARQEADAIPQGNAGSPGQRLFGSDKASGTAMIRITYCADCGYEPQALALVKALLMDAGAGFASIELVPWIDGSFEVQVDDDLVHSMARDGGFPDSRAIVDALHSGRRLTLS
jgi:selenoprotein W-related protein